MKCFLQQMLFLSFWPQSVVNSKFVFYTGSHKVGFEAKNSLYGAKQEEVLFFQGKQLKGVILVKEMMP